MVMRNTHDWLLLSHQADVKGHITELGLYAQDEGHIVRVTIDHFALMDCNKLALVRCQ